MHEIIHNEVAKMEEAGIIEPSTSAWSSPVVVVQKKNGPRRFCIDFRRLNAVTRKDAYPLSQITTTLDKLRGTQYLSTIDLQSRYWQIPVTPERKALKAFTVPDRNLMQFTAMSFKLHSALATF